MDFSKLKTRVISACILVVLLLAFTFAPGVVFTLAACAVSFVCLREMMGTLRLGTKASMVIANYAFALLYMVASFFGQYHALAAFFIITVLFIMALLMLSVSDHKNVAFSDVCVSLFSVLYVVVFTLHLAFLRQMEHGIAMVFLAYVGAWIPDTAAYFAGNLFGKRKLIEAISPKKTVAGAIGAVAGSVIGYLVYGGIMHLSGSSVNFISLFVLALLCGILAQFGDLAASVIKRTYKIKDFGKLIPGHGGLLDRIDSLIFIAPFVYYYISIFPVIS